jgi:hypothetical protein
MKVLAKPARGTETRRMARPRSARIQLGMRGRVVRATRMPTRPMRPRVLPERQSPRVKARVRRARLRVRAWGERRRKAAAPKATRPKRLLRAPGAQKASPR